ncbi:MAG TPA: pyridoxamine 5'-phosphate oxidase family protein [Longimicrobiales bacterium]
MGTTEGGHHGAEPAPTEKKLEELYDLIEGMKVCMFTTRRPDGYLVSRPMQVQERTAGPDFWFVTNVESNKLDELAHDPHVNLAFYRDRTGEWVSVAGTARVSQDRAKIHELYAPDWRAWFGDEGGARDGGPDDPRIALVFVDAHSVTFMKKEQPAPVVLFDIVKGIVTGERPDVGAVREMSREELERGRAA